jgi:hypothetical protein
VGVTFGFDWLRYGGCYYRDGRSRIAYGCGASYFVFPIAMQWNFWLAPKWSVFGEPGLYVYHGTFDDAYCQGLPGCGYPSRTGADLAFYVGGRYHVSEKVALTLRLGYPTMSFGVSFLP